MVNIRKRNRFILPRKQSRTTSDSGHAILSEKSVGGEAPASSHVLTVGAVSTFFGSCRKLIHILESRKGFPHLVPTGVPIPCYTLLWGPYSYHLSLLKVCVISKLANVMRSDLGMAEMR